MASNGTTQDPGAQSSGSSNGTTPAPSTTATTASNGSNGSASGPAAAADDSLVCRWNACGERFATAEILYVSTELSAHTLLVTSQFF